MTELEYGSLVNDFLFFDTPASLLKSVTKWVEVGNSSRNSAYIELTSYDSLPAVRLNFSEGKIIIGKAVIPLDLGYINYTEKDNGNARKLDISHLISFYQDHYKSGLNAFVMKSKVSKRSPVIDLVDHNFKRICNILGTYDLDALNETLDKLLYFDKQDMERKAINLKLEMLEAYSALKRRM